MLIAAMTTLVVAGPSQVSAQQLQGFVTGGTSAGENREQFPTVGGGVLLDVAKGWASVGGQGDVFFSNGYATGRAGVLAQGNIVRRRAFRPFVVGGYGWGEDAGPMFGAGIEWWSGRLGFRASVQHYRTHVQGFDCLHFGYTQAQCDADFRGGQPYTQHQPSVQFGVSWR
jgi:hypothetical protein